MTVEVSKARAVLASNTIMKMLKSKEASIVAGMASLLAGGYDVSRFFKSSSKAAFSFVCLYFFWFCLFPFLSLLSFVVYLLRLFCLFFFYPIQSRFLISLRSKSMANSVGRRRFAEEEIDCYLSGAHGRNDRLFGF